jgi:hypothetical protein
MNMHSEFSEWFRAASLPLQDDVLQKRWAGIEAFQADRDDVVSLVELFFGFFADKAAFFAKFRKVFQDADSSFRMRENNLELSVLAGASLVAVMKDSTMELGDFAALALVSCAAQNLRGTPCVAEIPELAVKHLARRTVNRGQLDTDDISDLDENQIEIKQLRRDLDIIGEESNVLWWVFGETSRDTNKRWSDYSVSQTALMAGKELANLTRIAPGPAAAAALLDRVVKSAKSKPPAQIAVKDAIAELALEWRQKFSKDNSAAPLRNLSPVSQGINMSVDLNDCDAWIQSFGSTTRIQRGGKIAPNLLAYQVYLECVMATIWPELE